MCVVGTSSSHSLEAPFWPLSLPGKPPGASRALSLHLPTGRRDGTEHSQPLETARATREAGLVLPGDREGVLGSPALGSSLTGERDGQQAEAVPPRDRPGLQVSPSV